MAACEPGWRVLEEYAPNNACPSAKVASGARRRCEPDTGRPDPTLRGHDAATVHRIEHLLYIAEYKRRQSAPGVKITRKNFGRDRRYPITNRYRDRG